jgi:hypothetical protein
LTTFIGREVELTQLAERLKREECRLLTLVGPGGVGKTRLAREVAVQVLPDSTDGVFFVALASLDRAEMVPPAIAQTIGLQDEGGQSLIEALRAWLCDRHLLLVLDNLEHLLAASLLIPMLLAAGTASATTAVVTGGPTTYNVSVSGITSSGTVIASIPTNVASDAASNGNVAASSIDNRVTFSRQSVYLPLVRVVQNSDAHSVPWVVATSATPTREER